MDLTKLHSKLVAEFGELLFFLLGKDCQLCLVGGVTRDFFLTGELVQDVDFEVRSKRPIEDIISEFPEQLTYEKVSYGIIKVRWNTFSVEFSPPRFETFIEGDFTHKNFTATINQNLTYEQSFARRDFTINAIGLEFHKEKLVLQDPYSGMIDLRNEILKPIDVNFTRDPVRFLRLIRFSLKLKFKISVDVENMIAQFNLKNLTSYYFKMEWKKSKNSNEFLRLFHHYVEKYRIQFPEWCENFRPLQSTTLLETPQEYLVHLLFSGKTFSLDNPQDFFDWGMNDVSSLKSFVAGLKSLNWNAIELLRQQNFDQVKTDAQFLKLHEVLSFDRQGQFSGNGLLKNLSSEFAQGYLKLVSKVSRPFSSELALSNQEKALFKTYLRLVE